MADSAEGTCELCGRHHVRLTEHHLTPKEEGGTFSDPFHKPREFRVTPQLFYSREPCRKLLIRIERVNQLARFVKWIRKQPPEKLVKTKKANERT
jgi:5-methylcytosine-specific restriction protein A